MSWNRGNNKHILCYSYQDPIEMGYSHASLIRCNPKLDVLRALPNKRVANSIHRHGWLNSRINPPLASIRGRHFQLAMNAGTGLHLHQETVDHLTTLYRMLSAAIFQARVTLVHENYLWTRDMEFFFGAAVREHKIVVAFDFLSSWSASVLALFVRNKWNSISLLLRTAYGWIHLHHQKHIFHFHALCTLLSGELHSILSDKCCWVLPQQRALPSLTQSTSFSSLNQWSHGNNYYAHWSAVLFPSKLLWSFKDSDN